MRNIVIGCFLLALVFFVISCEKAPQYPDNTPANEFLVDSIKSIGAVRSGEVQHFGADSLEAFVQNAAEYYRRFGCRDIGKADYMIGDVLISAAVYRYSTETNAYGVYVALRAPRYKQASIVDLGIEGFRDPTEITFVKGKYVVRVFGSIEAPVPAKARMALAKYLDSVIPGATSKPVGFAALPETDAVAGIEMYYPGNFLGFDDMPPVYYRSYVRDKDSLDAFVIIDSAGPTLLKMSKEIEAAGAMEPLPEAIAFDDGKGFIYNNGQFGLILCGIKGDKLVMFFGYTDSKNDYINEWLGRL